MLAVVVLLAMASQQYGHSIIEMANAPYVEVEVSSISLTKNGDADFKMRITNRSKESILVDVDELILSIDRVTFLSKGVAFKIAKRKSEVISDIRGQRRVPLKPEESAEMNRQFSNYEMRKVGNEDIDPILINEKGRKVAYSMYYMLDIVRTDRKVIAFRVEGMGICSLSYSLR